MIKPAIQGAAAALALTVSSGAASGDTGPALNPVPIKEWQIAAGGRTRDPHAHSADEVWFVGQGGHYLARLTPSTGETELRPLPDDPGPHNLVVGDDGTVWYAGNLRGYIGRYDPSADTIRKIGMPESKASDPHTLTFDDGQRHIWFTVQRGNYVGRLDVDSLDVVLVPVPTNNARPYGIRVGDDGTAWVALLGTNKLASVGGNGLELTEHVLPAADARPRRLEIAPDGQISYADYARGVLGRFDPASGNVTEVQLPGGADSRPYGTAIDAAGRVWVVTTGNIPNRFVGVDTRTAEIVSVTPIPSGAGAVRHMHFHAPSNTVWFGTDENTIGRASIGTRSTARPADP